MQLYCQNDYIIESGEKREDIRTSSEEEKFVTENFKYIDFFDWQKGMKFILMKDYITTTYMQDLSVHGKELKDFYHKILTIERIENGNLPIRKDFPGSPFELNIVFSTSDNDTIVYNYIGTISSVRKNSIPGMVYLNDIDKARELLIGRTIYIKSHYALKNIQTLDNYKFWDYIKKYTPYRIKQIGAGEHPNYPVKMIVVGNDSIEIPFYVILSGTNTANDLDLMKGKFENIFTFSNPRLKYKKISDSDWKLITEGKVRIGMNKEACELSWGTPEDINSTIGSYGSHEQWVYDGKYLYFENGILTDIQY